MVFVLIINTIATGYRVADKFYFELLLRKRLSTAIGESLNANC